MTATSNKAKEIFVQLIANCPPDEWASRLQSVCPGDEPLRRRVNALLQAHRDEDSFLLRPADPGVATIDQPPAERIGTLIGPYKLLEQIGEGGMGVVYVAEQTEPVRRRVALKIIKPGMDTKQVIARFEAERQALAMMDHPNIAKILDAGTVGGQKDEGGRMKDEGRLDNSAFSPHPSSFARPYFVMELVRGLPVTDYCDKARLSPRQRLELFIDVCHAVQHAHQKGVIHRDLKPSNVMITVHDGRPVAKVIDFGVAKAVGQQLTERTVYTAHTQLVGTPLYMSPEQADFSSQDVDTRSDVYSLGVLLYELLTGQTPFDKETLTKAGFDEMRRIIREDEPPSPSRRFSTLSAQAISTVSQHRSVDERHLGRVLRGELDWIVMKALEKDRSRRYESASALAADIQRYLSDDPVLACPPTTMYRFQKFARKHNAALTTAAAIAACLLLGTTVSAWQAVRATTAEAQANANEQKAVANEQKAVANEQRAVASAAAAEQKEQEAIKQRDEVKSLADKLAAKEQQLERMLYASNMNLAKSAWDTGKIGRVNSLLEQYRPQPGQDDVRGFEWHYLHRLCHSELLKLEFDAQIAAIAYSPDGTRLATALYDQTLKVWDAQTGKLLHSRKVEGSSDCVAYSPDGKRLAFATHFWDDAKKAAFGHEVKICDSQTGQELLVCKHAMRIYSLVFSPDGKRLATGSGVGERGTRARLIVWDTETGQELFTCRGHTRLITSLAFSPDGSRLASADHAWTAVWDTQTGKEVHSLEDYGANVAFSPDGKRLASGSKVLDAQTGKVILSPKGNVEGLKFSPDGKRLAGGGDSVKVWDAETGDELLRFRGYTGSVREVAFSPDGTRLASMGTRTVKVWDATTSQEARTLSERTGQFRSATFSPDGKRVAFGSSGTWDDAKNVVTEGEVRVVDVETTKDVLTLKGHSDKVMCVAYSPDGRLLVSGSADKTVKVRDAQSGRELLTFQGHTAAVVGVAFGPDSKRVASCSCVPSGIMVGPRSASLAPDPGEPGEVKVWDAGTGQELLELKGHSKFVNALAYSGDGKRLATLSRDQTVKVWDAETGREVHTLKVLAGAGGKIAFTPDSKRLAASSSAAPLGNDAPSTVKIWDVGTGEELLTLQSGRIGGLAFTADGKRLITCAGGGERGELKVWDSQTGMELLTVDGGGHRFGFVALSPDGHRLVGRDGGGTSMVKIWDATPLPEKP